MSRCAPHVASSPVALRRVTSRQAATTLWHSYLTLTLRTCHADSRSSYSLTLMRPRSAVYQSRLPISSAHPRLLLKLQLSGPIVCNSLIWV